MTGSVRATLETTVTDLSRSIGTFIALVWIATVVVMVGTGLADRSPAAGPIPGELLWVVVFVVAAIGATWLVGDGFDRLGVDPSGVWTFVWLAIVFLPLAFLPLRVALEAFTTETMLLNAAFALAATVAAGWLAFYGGLERLGLEPDDFIRVTLYAIALGALPIAAFVLFDLDWLTTDRVTATLAGLVQVAACWFGFTKTVP
ncbi:hypothetical protein [Halopiger goleimassiliensis]|uniref:hypothetical protein n=1 Tax=Halopiger goleimassiliensis TaxID=1293048 RepID=UPI000677DEA6|nr:hypothetical protein [Halopiger goleimassiliensis]